MALGFLLDSRRRGFLWLGVLGLAMAGGWAESGARSQRQDVLSTGPVSPALRVEHFGAAVIRTTSWPSPAMNNKWRAASVILAWQDRNKPSLTDPPQIGEGVMVTGVGTPPSPGTVISGLISLKVPPSGDLPGSFDYREFLAGRHLDWLGKIDEFRLVGEDNAAFENALTPIRSFLLDHLSGLFPRREADLAGAVLLGARTPGSRDSSLAFTHLGLAHLFAVSGLHVGILLGMIVFPGKLLGFPASARFSVVLLFLPLYTLLTGLPGSVVRAAGLGLLASGAGVVGRRTSSLRLLGLIFWATTVWEPVQVLDTGVRLSYLAAGGILVLVPLITSPGSRRNPRAIFLAALSVSLAAQWFTLPQVADSFGRFSLLAPAANIVAVPLFGLGIWAVVLALVSHPIWPWLGESLAASGWLVLRGLTGMVTLISQRTGGLNVGLAPTSMWTGMTWVLLTFCLLILLRRFRYGSRQNRIAILAALGIIMLGHGIYALSGARLIQGTTLKVWQFDVGQGDCSLVVFPDGWKCIIDTGGVYGMEKFPPDGPMSRSVKPFLNRGWIDKIDAVVLSHGHLDHTGGAPVLDQDFEVGRWVVGGDAGNDIVPMNPKGEIQEANSPATLHQQGDWELKVVYPRGPLPESFHENDRSLVLALVHRKQAVMVWSGDLESEGEKALLGQEPVPSGVQVWKAGHHGSNTSGSETWLNRLDPQLVLISSGVGNKYGHPNHGPYLAKGDTVALLRTDLEGSIGLEWDSNGVLSWKTSKREGSLPPAGLRK